MKEYLVLSCPTHGEAAQKLLNKCAAADWRVVGTLYYGGNDNSVILERERSA